MAKRMGCVREYDPEDDTDEVAEPHSYEKIAYPEGWRGECSCGYKSKSSFFLPDSLPDECPNL